MPSRFVYESLWFGWSRRRRLKLMSAGGVLAQLLLQWGADPCAVDNFGRTPAKVASTDQVRKLLSAGAGGIGMDPSAAQGTPSRGVQYLKKRLEAAETNLSVSEERRRELDRTIARLKAQHEEEIKSLRSVLLQSQSLLAEVSEEVSGMEDLISTSIKRASGWNSDDF